MELVIPWINYWVCHHFGMSIDSDPATSSGPVMTLNIKWCSVINLFHLIHSRPQFRGRVTPTVISLLSFSKKNWKWKWWNHMGLQAQIIGRGHAQFFLVSDRGPWKVMSILQFHFQFFFLKKKQIIGTGRAHFLLALDYNDIWSQDPK